MKIVKMKQVKVVFLRDVSGFGRKGQIKMVKSGFARNRLLPRKEAALIEDEAAQNFILARHQAEEAIIARRGRLVETLDRLAGTKLTMEARANAKGHLFAAVHPEEIAQLLQKNRGIEINPEAIFANQPIRTTGDHFLELRVGEKKVPLTLEIVKAPIQR